MRKEHDLTENLEKSHNTRTGAIPGVKRGEPEGAAQQLTMVPRCGAEGMVNAKYEDISIPADGPRCEFLLNGSCLH